MTTIFTLTTLDGDLVLDAEARTLTAGAEQFPVSGARCSVQATGEIRRRVTPGRFMVLGMWAAAWKKTVDERELTLVVDGAGYSIHAPVDPDQEEDVLAFAGAIDLLGAGGTAHDLRLAFATDRRTEPSGH